MTGNGAARRGLGDHGVPSNRDTFRPKSEPRGASAEGWGVDKVACFFPIDSFDRHHPVWGHKLHQAPGSTYEHRLRYGLLTLAGEAPLHLRVYWIPSYGQYGAGFEFNPARLVDPGGMGLCSVSDLPYAVSRAWSAIAEVVDPGCDLAEAKIKRLDVARDFFDVQDCTRYLTGWLRIPSPYSKRWVLEHDPRSGRQETLYKGSKNQGWVRAYDKYAESRGKARLGTFRVEVEAHERWCKSYGGIERIEDLSYDSVRSLLLNRFEWAGCSCAVTDCSRFFDKVEKLTDGNGKLWSEAKKDGFVGHQLRIAQGVARPLPNGRKADYNRALRVTGIPSPSDLRGGAGTVVRLDFETGREVLDDAA